MKKTALIAQIHRGPEIPFPRFPLKPAGMTARERKVSSAHRQPDQLVLRQRLSGRPGPLLQRCAAGNGLSCGRIKGRPSGNTGAGLVCQKGDPQDYVKMHKWFSLMSLMESGITFTNYFRAGKMVTHSLINVVHGFWDVCLPMFDLRSERISL